MYAYDVLVPSSARVMFQLATIKRHISLVTCFALARIVNVYDRFFALLGFFFIHDATGNLLPNRKSLPIGYNISGV